MAFVDAGKGISGKAHNGVTCISILDGIEPKRFLRLEQAFKHLRLLNAKTSDKTRKIAIER
jgi:hypothetical protein